MYCIVVLVVVNFRIDSNFLFPSFLPSFCTVGNKREEGRTESGRGRDEERKGVVEEGKRRRSGFV
jgi:hypothetical protein